jgi:hypothetical protein
MLAGIADGRVVSLWTDYSARIWSYTFDVAGLTHCDPVAAHNEATRAFFEVAAAPPIENGSDAPTTAAAA